MKTSRYQLGVSYYGNRFLKHAKRDLADISECCTYVVHTCSERDLYFHKSALANIFEETRKRGMRVWVDPWGVGGVFGGESFSKFLLDHRRSWQFLSTGEAVHGACLNDPVFRGFVKEWVVSVKELGAQVIFWDEPHIYVTLELELSKIYSCACPTCKGMYMKKYGEQMPKYRNKKVHAFRVETMKNFLQEVMRFAKKKKLINALTIYAFEGILEYDRLWNMAGSLEEVDIFGCDPYWRWHRNYNPGKRVSHFAEKVVKTCWEYDKEPHLWIQGMKFPKGTEKEISEAVLAAADAGVHNMAAWSYDGGELLDPVLSDNSQKVWKEIKKAYRKLL